MSTLLASTGAVIIVLMSVSSAWSHQLPDLSLPFSWRTMADDGPMLVPLHLETVQIAFMQLGDRVNAALHTQIGDRLRLQEQSSGVLRMLDAIHQVLI
jgi:hypothetical protein